MQHDILINWSPQETRVAMVENGAVQEIHIDFNICADGSDGTSEQLARAEANRLVGGTRVYQECFHESTEEAWLTLADECG